MTYSESLSRIKRNVNPKFWNAEDIEHYNNIVNAIEKQIPKKPKNDGWLYCPICGKDVCVEKPKHCSDCGQAIDWSDVE